MEFKKDVIGTRSINLTSADLAKFEPPKLNEDVRQIIVESGIQSLQAFVRVDSQPAMRDIIHTYWGIKSEPRE